MYKSKLLVAVTAVAAVLIGAATVSATGNHNWGQKSCEDDKEVVLGLQTESNGQEKPRYKKGHHKKCYTPQICEYNPQLPKRSKDCVKPEEPTVPEEPVTPTVPEVPVTPSVTPTASTTETIEVPEVVVEGYQGK